ncbi:MAG: MGMT family protein [Chloroflexi bacterium]|nr:MGMT family protein [Chloroflexota bacterium]MQC28179.1 methyltransferase [Chloroflexota bacterium]
MNREDEPRVVGPGWHSRVYAVVRLVPAGSVATYGQIAALLGSPGVARHVGYALAGASRAEEPVPWQRVINARGGISARGDLERGREQRELLEAEGVQFDERGLVDLARYRWRGAPP